MKRFLHRAFVLLLIPGTFWAQEPLLDSVELALHQEYTSLEAAIANPNNVIKLTLRKQKFKEFPKELFAMKNLQYLDLGKNSIRELPDSIIIFTNLQYLIADKNKLEALPRNIGELKNLKHINVSQNNISMLPISFGDLDNLEVADLWSNNLSVFPDSISKLKKLKVMDLRGILIPQNHQNRIQGLLPNTRVEFSPACNCSW